MQEQDQTHGSTPVEGAPAPNVQTVLLEPDATPKAPKPQVIATQPTPVKIESDNDEDFFTFRPSEAQASAATTSNVQASPAPSIASSGSSSRLRDAVLEVTRRLSVQLDMASSPRPSVSRDLSHISATSFESTDSNATIVPTSHAPIVGTGFYPNQAFSALHHQQYPPPHIPPMLSDRTGLSPPLSSGPMGVLPPSTRLPSVRHSTIGPPITPGLFTPVPRRSRSGTPVLESGYSSPYLHHLHTQVPKETHVADIDVDPISGRKIINDYEIFNELGRGTHGKVKLGRSLITGAFVAIKIVERFPKKRRLGRLGNAEDKVKREVAILKKARHPNVVALLEVIDDPARRKVYIVLERVDMGEIRWRAPGTREIAMVEYRRYERECKGVFNDERAELEDKAIIDLGRIRRAKAARSALRERRKHDHGGAWSLELAGDDEESELDSASRTSSSAEDIDSPELDRIVSRSKEHVPRAEHSDLLATVKQGRPAEAGLSDIAEAEDKKQPTDELVGTMYGAFEDPYQGDDDVSRSQSNELAPLKPVITEDDVNADIRGLTKNLSESDLAARAADILDCDLHGDLMYVPCMTIQAARESFRDTVLGLQYLHYQGIIHRDIKPPNLLQTKDFRTKISDFGVSYLGRPIDDDDDVSDAEPDFDEAKELAKNVGTAAFYAPELCFTDVSGDHPPIGKGIDIWALGITLFCMIFARVPFVDSEYVVMRRIAEEEVYLPSKRLRPVDNRPKSRSTVPRHPTGASDEFRGPNDLEYEELEDTLLDLLKRLLTKDVKKRATLEEVRHHPWVLEDLQDKLGWLDMSAPANTSEGKKIEISREDLETSVVPINLLLDKIKSGLKRAVGSVGLGRSSSVKKRNASQEGSVASSSSSVANMDGRRNSLHGEQPIVNALKASRDIEHPLSQSLAASPIASPMRYPPPAATTSLGTPRTTAPPSFSTPRLMPTDDDFKWPSTVSTTASSQTVKPAGKGVEGSYFDGSLPTSPTSGLGETPGGSHLGGLMSNATRLLKTVRDRSATGRSSALSSRSSDVGDAHGEPSVAVSTASAEGHLHAPSVLKDPSPASSRIHSPAGSRRSSIVSTSDFLQKQQTGFEEFGSYKDSPSGSPVVRNPVLFSDHKPPTPQTRPVSRLQSTESGFERAEEELLRRQIAEGLQKQNEAANAAARMQARAMLPVSPDESENALRALDSSVDDSMPPSVNPSLGTGPASPSSSVMPLMTPVSSDDRFALGVKTDTSKTSSPAMPVYQTDTPWEKPLEAIADVEVTPVAPGQAGLPATGTQVLDEDEGYHADAVLDSDGSDDSSDDDGGLLMMRRRPDPRSTGRSVSASHAQLTKQRTRRDTGDSRLSKRSSRRGSSRSAKPTAQLRTGSEPDESRNTPET